MKEEVGKREEGSKPAGVRLWRRLLSSFILHPSSFLLPAGIIFIGALKGINLLLLLGYLLLAVLGLNVFVARRAARRLSVQRRIIGPVFAQMPCPVEVTVSNQGWRAVVGVRIVDEGPDHRLSWFLARVEGRGSRVLRGEVVLPRRGPYRWGPVAGVSGYPFGLAWRRVELAPPEDVLVLPRLGWVHRGRLRYLLRGVGGRGERARRRPRAHPSAQARFHGLRPYRPGDSPRSIHWRTSARRGELIVREFADVPADDLVVVFDPSPPPAPDPGRPDEELFEQAVSLAASICWEWCRHPGDHLVLATAGPDPVVLDGLTGPAHGLRILECLAVQKPVAADAGALLGRLAQTALPPAAIVLVSAGRSALAGPLRQGLGRPVNSFDASAPRDLEFYQAPGR